MNGYLKIHSRFLILLVFILAIAILAIHLATVLYGFYFTGDTVTYFVPAFPGKKGNLLAVFAWHMNNYPPFVSYVLNLLRFLPVSFVTQHHLYLIISTLGSIIMTYLIAKTITPIKKMQIILVSLLLFIGTQSLMFLAALAEPLFIFFWLATTLALERFISTYKERYLLIFIITAGIMAIVKFQGVPVLGSFGIILAFFAYFNHGQKKYSVSLVALAIFMSWLPIFITALGNYLLHQSFFGFFDQQTDTNGKMLSYQLAYILRTVFNDTKQLLLSGLIIGAAIKWNKHMKHFIILAGIPAITYYFFVALGLSKIAANEAIQNRYFLPAYPLLILATVCISSRLIFKFQNLYKIASISLIFLPLIFGYYIYNYVNRITYEMKSPQSYLEGWVKGTGAEHSSDIRRFCRGKAENKYLLLKDSSRNWVAQSLGYYCQPIDIIQMEKTETHKLSKNSLIFTPYKIINPDLEIIDTYKGDKEVLLYQAKDETILDVKEVLKNLKFLD